MKTITVKHEVSPGRESCEFGGDFWGKEVCKYHTFRTQTHGRKAPALSGVKYHEDDGGGKK